MLALCAFTLICSLHSLRFFFVPLVFWIFRMMYVVVVLFIYCAGHSVGHSIWQFIFFIPGNMNYVFDFPLSKFSVLPFQNLCLWFVCMWFSSTIFLFFNFCSTFCEVIFNSILQLCLFISAVRFLISKSLLLFFHKCSIFCLVSQLPHTGSKQAVQNRLWLHVEMFSTNNETCRIERSREITVCQKKLGQLYREGKVVSWLRM